MASYLPIYPPGLTAMICDTISVDLVDGFPTSQTREKIYKQFCSFISEVSKHVSPCEVWIDGSFVTKKENPNDVDILVFVNLDDFAKFAEEEDGFDLIKEQHPCVDAYFSIFINDIGFQSLDEKMQAIIVNRRNYWKGQYGFDREDNPKGIVVLNAAEIVKLSEKEG